MAKVMVQQEVCEYCRGLLCQALTVLVPMEIAGQKSVKVVCSSQLHPDEFQTDLFYWHPVGQSHLVFRSYRLLNRTLEELDLDDPRCLLAFAEEQGWFEDIQACNQELIKALGLEAQDES